MKWLLIILLSIYQLSYAQDRCATDVIYYNLLENNPYLREQTNNANNSWSNYTHQSAYNKLVIDDKDSTYEIPVVFHIMHRGEPIGHANNPSDTQLVNLLKYVNSVFAGEWAEYPNTEQGGVKTPFRFVFASRDTYDEPTTGILRMNIDGYSDYNLNGITDNNELFIKSASRWPASLYYNVWVVHKTSIYINDTQTAAGYAYFPWSTNENLDGTVLIASRVKAGQPTLIHELGHALGLYHTFEGDDNGRNCPQNKDCHTDGDKVCDTEPDKRYPDCNAIINKCTNNPYDGILYNFMNYTNCQRNRFTAEQVSRMLFFGKKYRQLLLTSNKGEISPNSLYHPQAYPNPSKGEFYLPFTLSQKTLVTIYDNLGKLVQAITIKQPTNTINLTGLQPGCYILKIILQDNTVINRITIL